LATGRQPPVQSKGDMMALKPQDPNNFSGMLDDEILAEI
jgi:hypothetical protein